jgi:Na+/H+ antiporter NhaD/arsenite permease-like protein
MLLYKLSIPNTLFHAYLLIVGIVSQLFCNTGAILIFYITVLIKKQQFLSLTYVHYCTSGS